MSTKFMLTRTNQSVTTDGSPHADALRGPLLTWCTGWRDQYEKTQQIWYIKFETLTDLLDWLGRLGDEAVIIPPSERHLNDKLRAVMGEWANVFEIEIYDGYRE
jgi:hypothetical protein